MKKVLKSRRAVSPVFSTILLILIVTIAMSTLFTFVVGYSSGFQQGLGSARLEMIEVEDVWFKPETPGKTEFIIISRYNYGELNVTVVSVYMNGLPVSLEYRRVVVPPEGHVDLSTVDPKWDPFVRYHIRLVSERGSDFDVNWVSPFVP